MSLASSLFAVISNSNSKGTPLRTLLEETGIDSKTFPFSFRVETSEST
jgi:hypothetical protein